MSGTRQYHIMGFDHNEPLDLKFHVNELFHLTEDPAEVFITLEEITDTLLDMQVNDVIPVKTARDHKESLGVVRRIK